MQDCLDAVFSRLPLADNYFWRVYMTGRYTRECCPDYLKPENFQKLRDGLADRVRDAHRFGGGLFDEGPAADHAFRAFGPHGLALDAAAAAAGAGVAMDRPPRRAGARILWRSAGLRTEFVDRTQIIVDGRPREVGELLTYDRPLAEQLHPRCRVHTYGSFYIADLAA